VSLASFFIEDVQELMLIGYQWMNGIVVVGWVGAFEDIDKCWSSLGVKRERKITSNDTYQSWDFGSIDGSGIPFIEGKCHALRPLEEQSHFCCVDLLDPVEVPMEHMGRSLRRKYADWQAR
jgi:hypothetical protein